MQFGTTILLILFSLGINLVAQDKALDYYLPTSEYISEIPTPKEVLGYQIGDLHISHDQIRIFVDEIDRASDRVIVKEIGRTYERRPLQNIFISTPENLSKLSFYQEEYHKLSDPKTCDAVDLSSLPAIVYQGYSIHGNESSGANAAMLMLYHLVAGKSAEVEETLKHCIIILDPCMNPDGLNRFASWANSHKGNILNGDKYIRELNEPWPKGRTNHYWFDLNRDWLLLTHPESRARIKQYHAYKPLILTDHHEMGTNSTFFFQPGIPSRTNPNTPQENQDITGKIGEYHANYLDAIGSLYYTKASFDDYYYGKGSTYPDGNGTIGILFEQASSRGHLQESKNGLLSFPFTIRNQVTTSLSTLKAAVDMRLELLEYRKWFYKEARKEAKSSKIAGYLFTDQDHVKTNAFIRILLQHQIDVYTTNKDLTLNSKAFEKENSYYVPLEQRQYKMVKTIFEKVKTFPDSLFYDVSAWTMPLAFDLRYEEIEKSKITSISISKEKLNMAPRAKGAFLKKEKAYAYVIDWKDYHSPSLLYSLQSKGLRVKMSQQAVFVEKDLSIAKGAIIIPVQNQNLSSSEIENILEEWTKKGVHSYTIGTGLTKNDFTLGSPFVVDLKMPKIMILAGKGTGYADAGEMWHQLDIRYQIPVSVVDINQVNQKMIDRYNTIIMANANPTMTESTLNALKKWTRAGGTIIATKKSAGWLASQNLISLKTQNKSKRKVANEKYQMAKTNRGSRVIGGAILEAKMDMSHPLTYGYEDNTIATFRRGTTFYAPTSNPYATPIKYTRQPALSGYIPRGMEADIVNGAAVTIHKSGTGSIICLHDSPVFRGYWYGGHRLLANALFFSKTLDSSTKQ